MYTLPVLKISKVPRNLPVVINAHPVVSELLFVVQRRESGTLGLCVVDVSEDFTVVGIGDMSGDVFGNGIGAGF